MSKKANIVDMALSPANLAKVGLDTLKVSKDDIVEFLVNETEMSFKAAMDELEGKISGVHEAIQRGQIEYNEAAKGAIRQSTRLQGVLSSLGMDRYEEFYWVDSSGRVFDSLIPESSTKCLKIYFGDTTSRSLCSSKLAMDCDLLLRPDEWPDRNLPLETEKELHTELTELTAQLRDMQQTQYQIGNMGRRLRAELVRRVLSGSEGGADVVGSLESITKTLTDEFKAHRDKKKATRKAKREAAKALPKGE